MKKKMEQFLDAGSEILMFLGFFIPCIIIGLVFGTIAPRPTKPHR